jgi:4-hydroxythreonine-4-phosphate dehydrogenase
LNQILPRIAVTPGEPSGIGPDVVIDLATSDWPVEIVVIADPDLLRERANSLGVPLDIQRFDALENPLPGRAGRLLVAEESLAVASIPGQPDASNAGYVLDTLRRACNGCLDRTFSAMVTGPVDKSLINAAGVSFSGHTEYLAQLTDSTQPVMLLVAGDLRVALVTTHLALRDVPAQITERRLRRVLETLDHGLRKLFDIESPRITVLGLNPHAGESGYLGTEEQQVIEPLLDALRAIGMQLTGPLPADTAFTPPNLAHCDAVLAMYHDQGLPVLKHAGFGEAVNVTLGLPIIRTSVDHGTAFDLAGTGRANPGSLRTALQLAIKMQAHAL